MSRLSIPALLPLLAIVLCLPALDLAAQDGEGVPAPPAVDRGPARHSVSSVQPADPWKTRYELGPGDVLSFRMYGKPDLDRTDVAVSPDGTIDYLQARRLSVKGMTIPEVKTKLEELLAGYHRDVQLIVTPAALGSKSFTILGQVRRNGTFPLTKPISLIEAVAQSGGAAIGRQSGTGVAGSSLTATGKAGAIDFDRSFIVRSGKVLDVDLGQLYLRGDISQNIQIEAGDYIYLASNLRNQIYVFGSVAKQGGTPFEHRMTVIGAITAAGGYSSDAWKDRVLIIRGSLVSPELTVVDTKELLQGKAQNVPLEPEDIVFVSRRPWVLAEEILDAAIRGVIQGYSYRLAEEAINND